MKKRRIFIAINLPEEIKNVLGEYEMKWPELPCRWVKKENIHITLVFLGYLSDDEVARVCDAVKTVLSFQESFKIRLSSVSYGPEKSFPKMIWVEGESDGKLEVLQEKLEDALSESKIFFVKENRKFTFHITLCRLNSLEFRALDIDERPDVNETISLELSVLSVEIMESELKRDGPEYKILQSFDLKR